MTGTINNGHRADVESRTLLEAARARRWTTQTMVAFPGQPARDEGHRIRDDRRRRPMSSTDRAQRDAPSMVVLTVTAVTLEA